MPQKSSDRCYTNLLTDMVQIDFKDLWPMVSSSESHGFNIVYNKQEESNQVLYKKDGNFYKLVFDDLKTLEIKLKKIAIDLNLGGIGVWQAGSLDYGEKYNNMSMAYWKLMDDTIETMKLNSIKTSFISNKL